MMELILTATGCCVLLMFGLWLVHFPLRNAGIVDAGWSLGMPLCALVYALRGNGWPDRAWMLAAMATLWGLRLGGYLLFTRVFGHAEEGRYVALRASWKSNIPFKFLLFFEAQALLSGLLSIPFYLAATNPAPGFSRLEYLGISLWFVGWIGESLADWQLWRFKTQIANHGKTCRVGLWNYSRHPNYFFELVIWIGMAVYALLFFDERHRHPPHRRTSLAHQRSGLRSVSEVHECVCSVVSKVSKVAIGPTSILDWTKPPFPVNLKL